MNWGQAAGLTVPILTGIVICFLATLAALTENEPFAALMRVVWAMITVLLAGVLLGYYSESYLGLMRIRNFPWPVLMFIEGFAGSIFGIWLATKQASKRR